MSSIDVNFVTWPNHPQRFEYFMATVMRIMEMLTASEYNLRFHCSCESERDHRHHWFGPSVEDLCSQYGIDISWRDAPANLGANMNAALRMGTSPTVFLVQDDWRLLYPLDLSAGAKFLEAGGADLVRYSYPDLDHMRPTFLPSDDNWPRIDLAGRWPYGDDPHLRRRDFMDRWGWYLEGGGHGTASATLMRKLIDGGADIRVADRCYFRHFGDVTAVLDDNRNRRVTRD